MDKNVFGITVGVCKKLPPRMLHPKSLMWAPNLLVSYNLWNRKNSWSHTGMGDVYGFLTEMLNKTRLLSLFFSVISSK